MPFGQMPQPLGVRRNPLQEALEALQAQMPEQQAPRPTFSSPAQAERNPLPAVPPAPSPLRPVSIPTPPERAPQFQGQDPSVVGGEFSFPPQQSPFSGVSRENAAQGLAGLQAAQGNQFSPFSEYEMARHGARGDADAANFWGPRLKESQQRHASMEGIQQKALEGISGAIAGTHPAVQFHAEQEARRKSMPATITAQGQFRAAQEAAQSRRDVGEASLERGMHSDRAGMADTVMQAIRAMRAKQGGLVGNDAMQLRALENLYDMLSDPLTGATFVEATEELEGY